MWTHPTSHICGHIEVGCSMTTACITQSPLVGFLDPEICACTKYSRLKGADYYQAFRYDSTYRMVPNKRRYQTLRYIKNGKKRNRSQSPPLRQLHFHSFTPANLVHKGPFISPNCCGVHAQDASQPVFQLIVPPEWPGYQVPTEITELLNLERSQQRYS